jgi:two-component system, NarL family, invasion response regulator UvrY
MTTSKTRVLIVDDHAVVRAGFRQLLATTDDIEATGEAGTAAAALAEAATGGFDVVLLDISLPDAGVLETVSALRRKHPDLPILVVSMHAEEQYAANLMRAGVSGFFPKAGAAEDMLQAIRMIAAGKKYMTAKLATALAKEAAGDVPQPAHRQLSAREFQIFVQLAAGKTITDIGSELSLSVKTISTYRTRILEKMNLSRNAELTSYALRNNLMS